MFEISNTFYIISMFVSLISLIISIVLISINNNNENDNNIFLEKEKVNKLKKMKDIHLIFNYSLIFSNMINLVFIVIWIPLLKKI